MSPQIVLAVLVATGVWGEDGDDLVVTSLADGAHSPTSLHYRGDAVDFRVSGVQDPVSKVDRLRERLGGKDYDVIYEGTHIHVEYQPRQL